MDQIVGAAHSGGSCQISLSYDKGQTWVVVQSWQGNCPRVSVPGTISNHYDLNQNYTFNIPSSFPSGDRVIVAWSWVNASGNREFYMSCSCISIQGNSTATTTTPHGPPLLIANLPAQAPNNPSTQPTNDSIWEQCHTLDDTSIIYPLRYQGVNPAIYAPVALNLQPFLGGNDTTCGSDNQAMVSALGRFDSGPISSASSGSTDLPTPSSSLEETLERRQTSDGTSTTIITAEITGSWMYISLPYMLVVGSAASVSSAGQPMADDPAPTDPTPTNLAPADLATIVSASTDGVTPADATTFDTADAATADATTGHNLITTSSVPHQLTLSGSSNGQYLLTVSSNSSNWTFTGGLSPTMSGSASTGSSQSSDASSTTLGLATAVTLLAVTTAILVSSSMHDNC